MSVYGGRLNTNRDPRLAHGMDVVAEAMCNPGSVQLYESVGVYYALAENVKDYMFMADVQSVDEAVRDIASANNITNDSICILGARDRSVMSMNESVQSLEEKAAEADSTDLHKAEKMYKAMLKTCKDKAETKKEIDDAIKGMKSTIDQMKKAQKDAASGKNDGKVMYVLKGLFIPWNDLYRCIKYNDWEQFVAGLAGSIVGIGAVTNAVVRWTNYDKMLQRCIDRTQEAIDYLEKKKKEL